MSALFLAMVAAARAGCGEPEQREVLIGVLERAAVEGRFEVAEVTRINLLRELGCGALAEPELVARLWLAEAVLLSARGETEAADGALAAASRLSPTTWNEQYGPALKRRWGQARLRPPPEPGRVRVEPLPPGYEGAIDGATRELPAEIPSGLHLLQVSAQEGPVLAAQIFDLPPGLDLVLEPRLPEIAPAPVAPVPRPVRPRMDERRKRRLLHALAVGGAGLLVYSGSIATNALYYQAPVGQRDPTLRAVNNGLVLGAAGIGLASGALLVRAVAAP